MRALALLGAGSMGIHQLRYAIGYGSGSSHALAIHGHAYLGAAMPVVMGLALFALATAMTRIARGGGRTAPLPGSTRRLWLLATLALAAIFATQETLEGSSAIAHGGWIGLALAIPTGLLIALVLRGADAAERMAPVRLPLRFTILTDTHGAAPSLALAGRTLALALGARGPPLRSIA